MIVAVTKDASDTQRIAEVLAGLVGPGDVLVLAGDLGAGKTALTQGLARGLGVAEQVTSPTFTLIHHYRGEIPIYHFDVYRLQSDKEFEDLGYEEEFFGEGISIVEWADKVYKFLPAGSRIFEFKVLGDDARQITSYRKEKA